MADLQPYVIHTALPKIVRDARREPLANQEVVRRARMRGLAIVPILNRVDVAIGTIHVEREDGQVPSPEDVEDLEAFARQLAVAIEQTERVDLLLRALDKIPEPVVVVDGRERCRYANKPASDLLHMASDWHDRSAAVPISDHLEGKVLEQLRESLDTGRRLVNHITLSHDKEYRAAALSSGIRDHAGRTVGAVLHLQDLNYLYRVLEAFQLVAGAGDTESALQSLLTAARLLGHLWGRLYRLDPSSGRLIGRSSFGYQDPASERAFNEGQVFLPNRQDTESHSWLCLEQRELLVFCRKPTLSEGSV